VLFVLKLKDLVVTNTHKVLDIIFFSDLDDREILSLLSHSIPDIYMFLCCSNYCMGVYEILLNNYSWPTPVLKQHLSFIKIK